MANMNAKAIEMIRDGMDRWYRNARIDHDIEGGFISAEDAGEYCIRVKWYESGKVYEMDLHYDSCNLDNGEMNIVYLWDENRDNAQREVGTVGGCGGGERRKMMRINKDGYCCERTDGIAWLSGSELNRGAEGLYGHGDLRAVRL